MAFGDEDLKTFFDDFGVDLTYKGITVKANKDVYDERDAAALGIVDVVEKITRAQLSAKALSSNPKRGEAVTLDGVSMKVREPLLVEDGAVLELWLVDP